MTNAAPARLLDELRREGISDPRVLDAIARIPRDLFVPAAFRAQAWENVALPIGHGQTISQPYVVAAMTQALALGDRDIVLEIGTGSGYQAAILALLARRVFTVERHRALIEGAQEKFKALRLHNVTARFGDGTKAWPEQSAFDRIMVTAAAAEIPPALLESLADGGLLVTPVGDAKRDQKLLRVRRKGDSFASEDLGAVRFVPLVKGLPRAAKP